MVLNFKHNNARAFLTTILSQAFCGCTCNATACATFMRTNPAMALQA
jgi:hypothetical protein